MPEFQDRLSYIDKRYDHIRKLAHALRKKVNELEDIMALDNDEENMDTIKRLLAEIKREKQVIRDEVHVIKGELSTAMYNEDLRTNILNFLEQFEEWWYEDKPERRLTGEWRRLKMEQPSEEELDEIQRERERSRERRPDTGSSSGTYRETSF